MMAKRQMGEDYPLDCPHFQQRTIRRNVHGFSADIPQDNHSPKSTGQKMNWAFPFLKSFLPIRSSLLIAPNTPAGIRVKPRKTFRGNCGTIFTPRTIGTFWESYRLNFQ